MASLPSETKGVTKAAKEVAAIIMPGMSNIQSLAVATTFSAAVKDVADRFVRNPGEAQKNCLMNRYEDDRLEQHMRSDNVRIAGLSEEEEILQANPIDCGLRGFINSSSCGKTRRQKQDRDSPLLPQKDEEEVMDKKKEFKNKSRNIFVNDDLTPLLATLLKIVKEQDSVSTETT